MEKPAPLPSTLESDPPVELTPTPEPESAPAALLDQPLAAELPTFELFFKTFGFKRVHGRVWGLLVLSGQPLSSREVSSQLSISQGATSTTLNELREWGAVTSEFDSSRRCHLHSAVGNAISIVATVFRRREQVVFDQFKHTSQRALSYIQTRYGEKDPRVFTLRSIITTCEIGEALMQLVFAAVGNALGDPQSILSRAIGAAFKVGVGVPAKVLFGSDGPAKLLEGLARAELDAQEARRALAERGAGEADAGATAEGAPSGEGAENERGRPDA